MQGCMMECNIEYLEIKNDVFREEIINPTQIKKTKFKFSRECYNTILAHDIQIKISIIL